VAEFELLRYITIGQYLPTGSVVHRLDPRVKLVAFALLVAAISFNGYYAGNIILTAAVLLLLYLSQVSMAYALKGVRPALPVILILAVMQVLVPPQPFLAGRGTCTVVANWGGIHLTDCTVRLIVISALRFFQLILLTNLLTFSTSITELTHGTESLLRPLQRIGFPAHELAMVAAIALRFAPILAQEMERIMKAQISRGADFGGGSRWRFFRRTRRLLPLLVPLFLNALRRAEELILAMEARCYVGGRGRTRLVQLQSRPADYLALGLVAILASFMLLYDFSPCDRALTAWVSRLLTLGR